MERQPWSADRELDIAVVRRAITSQFADIPASRISRVGSGWDNDVFLVDRTWIFRFPRREEVAKTMAHEIAATALAAEALSDLDIRVPEITRIGRPGSGFPYRFLGYERLDGVPAEDVPGGDSDAASLGGQIGKVLSRLHSISIERATRSGLSVDDHGVDEWYEEALRIAEDLASRESGRVRSCIDWLLGGPKSPSRYDGPIRFLHNDICPDHVLLERGTCRVTALLDFGDAALGDPALDFVMLPSWLGRTGTRGALRSYELGQDAGFVDRVAFLARVTSLTWLHDAHLQGADVTKHRRWVERAFT